MPRSQGLAGRWKGVMIKIVAAVALASVVAFSAWAQSYDPSVGSGNLNTTRHDDMSPRQSDASENCCAILTWTAIARSSSVRRYRGPGRKDNGGTLAKDVPLIDVPDEDPTSWHPHNPRSPAVLASASAWASSRRM